MFQAFSIFSSSGSTEKLGTDEDGTPTLKIGAGIGDSSKNITIFYKVEDLDNTDSVILNFVNDDGSLVEFRDSIVYDNGYPHLRLHL